MAISVDGSGPYDQTKKQKTSYNSYTFFSGELTTTNSFEDNDIEFGANLGELFLINMHQTNWVAFQFEELFGTNKASGVIPARSNPNEGVIPITFRRANRSKIRIRSLVDGSQAEVYIFGI